MSTRTIAALCAAALLATFTLGCSGTPTEETPQAEKPLDGTFPLVRWNGQPLPVDRGPVGTRSGVPTPCRMMLDEGALALDAASGRFDLRYVVHDSCTGQALSRNTATGVFVRAKSSLSFREDNSSGALHIFTGMAEPTEIMVDYWDKLVFRR